MTGMAGGNAGGGDAGQQAQGEAAQQGQEAQGGPDIASVLESMQASQQDLRGLLESQHQLLQSEPWKAAEAEAEPDAPDFSQYLDVADPNFDPADAAQRIAEAAKEYARQSVQEFAAPIQQEWQQMRTAQEAANLIAEFPEMGEEATQKRVLEAATAQANLLGRPDLAHSPAFWRLTYMASKANDAAQQEAAQQPPAAHLEGGGGAGPATGQQVNPADQFAGFKPRRVLPFG